MTDPAALEALARRIAEDAHAGQVDKLGEPYIGHVSRVAGRLEDPLDRAVAWLHDVLEDCPGWDYQRLVWGEERLWADDEYTAWRRVCMDAEKLTHRPNEPRARYYERVSLSPRAVRVKLADIADNTDPDRMAQLDDATRERLVEKYRKARQFLAPDKEN